LDSEPREIAHTQFDRPSVTDAGNALSWRSHGTLLIVDDDPNVRDLMASLLGRCGFSVLTAHDGRSAVELFGRCADDIRLALVDLVLPDMDGEAVFQAMRQRRPDLRAVLCTGCLTEDAADAKRRAGWTEVIRKPFHLAGFLQTIRRALGE
jgi:DNA-binding NtrC family response regulator